MAINEGNKNAEKWTLDKATELFDKAIELSNDEELAFDFIGEVARHLGTHRHQFTHLKTKFPELESKHSLIIGNLEANCFYHTKKGEINTAAGIINLKSNHKWSDRVETTVQGGDKPVSVVDYSKISTEALKEIANAAGTDQS